MEKELKSKLSYYKNIIDDFLKQYVDKLEQVPNTLRQSMGYSLLAGGKRIRPIFCICWAQVFGKEISDVLPFACGIELIHTYSLIHDDLPAMDDDELRRGRPSNHKVFGEAVAILAGDGLLTDSFYLMLKAMVPHDRLIYALQEISDAAGPRGMVGGQVLDMELTGKLGCDLKSLRHMHALKTGAMIKASCSCGSILGGAKEREIGLVREYGKHVGLAFQIADDILDVIGDEKKLGKPVGSDERQGKITYPMLVGMDESYNLAKDAVSKARKILSSFHGPQIDFLDSLTDYIIKRTF